MLQLLLLKQECLLRFENTRLFLVLVLDFLFLPVANLYHAFQFSNRLIQLLVDLYLHREEVVVIGGSFLQLLVRIDVLLLRRLEKALLLLQFRLQTVDLHLQPILAVVFDLGVFVPLIQKLGLLVDLLADACIVFEQLILLLLEEVVP